MKRGLILLTGLFLLSSSAWSAGTLKVTTPNGGQKWTTGKSYAVKWSKGSAGATVKIQLLKSGKHYKWVSKKTKNDGKHTWKIPSTVATSSAYKIKIVSIKNKKVFDTSNKTFTITKTGGGGSAKLAIISPNGGENWGASGQDPTITWTQTGAGSSVRIELLKGGKRLLYLTISTANDGVYSLGIPCSATTGSNYTVKVISLTDSSIFDNSDGKFSITNDECVDDTITVSNPNGGESWKTGQTKNISWKSLNPGSPVDINLYKGGAFYLGIAQGTTNDGSYKWTIPSMVAAGNNYRVKISSSGDSSISDQSDGTLTITAIVTSTITVTGPNGGESWETGQTKTITWKSSNAGNWVNINLDQSGSNVSTVALQTENDGSYSWTIPSSISTGNNYKIKIADTNNSVTSDLSNANFAIEETPPETISGTIWQDLNDNESFDPDEGIKDVRCVDLSWDGGQRRICTHVSGGNYSFESLDAGTYSVSTANVWPHLQTHLTPASVIVTLLTGEQRIVNFGFTSPCEGLPSYSGCP